MNVNTLIKVSNHLKKFQKRNDSLKEFLQSFGDSDTLVIRTRGGCFFGPVELTLSAIGSHPFDVKVRETVKSLAEECIALNNKYIVRMVEELKNDLNTEDDAQ